MIVSHYSNSCELIKNSKRLWMSRLIKCKGQDDFCLSLKKYRKMMNSLNLAKIKYNALLPKDEFKKVISCKNISEKYYLIEKNIYGTCFIYKKPNSKFITKYGNKHLNFELNNLKKHNSGFVFVEKVIYSLKHVEQYIYDLTLELYMQGEAFTRYALDLKKEDLPDNYEDIFSRTFYYLKVLYKKKKFSFENEIRVFLDSTKIDSGILESFDGADYHYTNNINTIDFNKYVCKIDDNHFALKIDNLNLCVGE